MKYVLASLVAVGLIGGSQVVASGQACAKKGVSTSKCTQIQDGLETVEEMPVHERVRAQGDEALTAAVPGPVPGALLAPGE